VPTYLYEQGKRLIILVKLKSFYSLTVEHRIYRALKRPRLKRFLLKVTWYATHT